MVRQTIAICGEPKDDKSSVQINEEIIDIFREEQLSEQFLCEVNPLGQVRPTMLTGRSDMICTNSAAGTSADIHSAQQSNCR